MRFQRQQFCQQFEAEEQRLTTLLEHMLAVVTQSEADLVMFNSEFRTIHNFYLLGGDPTAEAVAFHRQILEGSGQRQRNCDDALLEILLQCVMKIPSILDEVRFTLRNVLNYRQLNPDAFVLRLN